MSLATELAAKELQKQAAQRAAIESQKRMDKVLLAKTRAAWERVVVGLQEFAPEYNEKTRSPIASVQYDGSCEVKLTKESARHQTTVTVHLSTGDNCIRCTVRRKIGPNIQSKPVPKAVFLLDLADNGGLKITDMDTDEAISPEQIVDRVVLSLFGTE